MEPRVSIITLGVSDLERSYQFYHHVLGFPTTRDPQASIIFFQTGGVCLAVYPLEKLAEDISASQSFECGSFSGITLAHNTRTKEEVDAVLALAECAGGKIEKPAEEAVWSSTKFVLGSIS
ncbi:MAG: VOC family protein [Halioglobus sp.]